MFNRPPQDLVRTYSLTNPADILDKLRLLERRQTPLTLASKGSESGLLTTIARILPARGLLGVDAGTDDSLVTRLLATRGLSVSGQLDGVLFRFEETGELRAATLHGRDLLALSIPTTLFWLQRRQFYRAFVPYDTRINCEITLPNGEANLFEVINLSVRGVALLDKSGSLRVWGRPGQVFEDCRLMIPGLETEHLDLEIRSKLETSDDDARIPTMRVGFAFRDIKPGLEAKIQRILHEFEIRARQQRKHLDFSD